MSHTTRPPLYNTYFLFILMCQYFRNILQQQHYFVCSGAKVTIQFLLIFRKYIKIMHISNSPGTTAMSDTLVHTSFFFLFMSLYANRDTSYIIGKPTTAIINLSSHFLWELMWSEPKFTGLRSLESSQAVDFYIPFGCR